MIEQRIIRRFDFTLLMVTLGIIAYGCVMIYSASKGKGDGASYVVRQLMWTGLGSIGFLLMSAINYQLLTARSRALYLANLALLITVMIMGASAKGAQRWIDLGPFRLQPSELAKLALIITLANFLANNKDRLHELRTVVRSFIHVAVPMVLILKQPDLGTSLVIVAIWFGMLYIAGATWKHLATFALAGLLLGVTAWHVPGALKDYQKARLTSFINPESDPRGSGYHIRQSRIAIGSGQFLGKGPMKGTQSRLRFIPEQHTDFIFTIVGEEMGFIGSAALIFLYFMLMWRGATILSETEDYTGRLIAAGILSMFLFHIMVNLGMTMGIMPVTGVPLPLFSYGGSNLLANLTAIGLLMGIYIRRHKIAF